MNRIALGQHALTNSLNARKKTYMPWSAGGPTCWRIHRLFAVCSTAMVLCVMLGAAPPADAASVTLSPGANIQSAVNSNPAGTTFVLQAGVYHWQGVTSPKNGDSFIGQAGAIMDGAEVLTGWTQVSINGVLYWTTAGGTPKPTPSCGATPLSACCDPGYPGCAYVQNLYVNDVEYQHVTSLANIVAGMSWYY